MRLQDLPDEFVIQTEAFIFFATLSSGVRHFVASIDKYVMDSGDVIASVCIEHDEAPPEWCEDYLSYSNPTIPGDAGFTFFSPPLPHPDKLFLEPDDDTYLIPWWN